MVVYSINDVGKTGQMYRKKKLDYLLMPHPKINLKNKTTGPEWSHLDPLAVNEDLITTHG